VNDTYIEQINQLYRKVFSSAEGQKVLLDILNDCGYFSLEDMTDPADFARFNVGRRILGKCSVFEPVYAKKIVEETIHTTDPRQWLKNLFTLPIRKKHMKEDKE
jgi:hypothetical protein